VVNPILAGSRLLAEDLLEWSDAINFLHNPPGAQLFQSAAQSLANGSFVPITFTVEGYDNRNAHSTSSNTSRYVCAVAGRYQVSGKITFTANSTGRRGSRWHVNGAVVDGTEAFLPSLTAPNEPAVVAVTTTALLAVNDYVELCGFQESGGALNTSVANVQTRSFMHVRWVGNA
jgi:hypothetical protein